MSEIADKYLRLRERKRQIQNRMERQFIGAVALWGITLVETGGFIYNQVENPGAVNEITGITVTGMAIGVLGAKINTRNYKKHKEKLAEAETDYQTFRNEVLSPDYNSNKYT